MAGVLHDHGSGSWQIVSVEIRRTIGSEVGCHPRSGAAAPEGITIGIDLKLFSVFENEADCSGEILTGGIPTRPVDQRKGVIAHL